MDKSSEYHSNHAHDKEVLGIEYVEEPFVEGRFLSWPAIIENQEKRSQKYVDIICVKPDTHFIKNGFEGATSKIYSGDTA